MDKIPIRFVLFFLPDNKCVILKIFKELSLKDISLV